MDCFSVRGSAVATYSCACHHCTRNCRQQHFQVGRRLNTTIVHGSDKEEQDQTRQTFERKHLHASEQGVPFPEVLAQHVQNRPHELKETLPKLQQFATPVADGTMFSEKLLDKQGTALFRRAPLPTPLMLVITKVRNKSTGRSKGVLC